MQSIAIAGTVIGALVTAATIAIPLMVAAGERPTQVDSLRSSVDTDPVTAPTVAAAAAAFGLTDAFDESRYRRWDTGGVPLDAPWDTFPAGDPAMGGCSDAQEAWLAEHAVRDASPQLWGTFSNTATGGGSLSLRNLRLEGDFVSQDPPRVSLECFIGGRGDGVETIWTSLTFGDPTAAVYTENPYASTAAGGALPPDLVGTPFQQNLAPGELAQIFVRYSTLDESRDWVGQVLVDVVVGDDVQTVALTEGHLQTTAPLAQGVSLMVFRGELFCLPSGADVDWFSISNADEAAEYRCSAPAVPTLAGG